MLTIDGSRGEGGGQILRTALGLSILTQTPFRIHSIRAGREKPGLLRQHLTAVNAAAAVGCAEVTGAQLGSQELTFIPRMLAPGNHHFAVGTAGSATLVFQTILPALLRAGEPSRIAFEGGTHNMAAPPFDFLERAFLPLVNRAGASVTATLERPGFFPAGGGRFAVEVTPVTEFRPVELNRRGQVLRRRAVAVLAGGLPRHIAERELETVRTKLSWPEEALAVEEVRHAHGPGNVVVLDVVSEACTEVFTGFGAPGVSAEAAATRAVEEARAYLAADVPVGEHLADQLVLVLAVAAGGSFTTSTPTLHTTTNIETIRLFLDRSIEVVDEGKGRARIVVS